MAFLFAALLLIGTRITPISRRIAIAFAAATNPLVLWFYLPQLPVIIGESTQYFGATQAEYLAGVFNTLPVWLDRVLSLLSLISAKILYFVGVRPSYGETPTLIVLARAAAGLIFLPGIIYALARGARAHRLLLVIYMLPVLLGASQEALQSSNPAVAILFRISCI